MIPAYTTDSNITYTLPGQYVVGSFPCAQTETLPLISRIEDGRKIDRNIGKSTADVALENLANVRERVLQLKDEAPEDDFIYAPTKKALERFERLVTFGYALSSGEVVRPLISPDGQGGLVLEWRKLPKEVKLIIPAKFENKPYLYYENGDIYDVIENIKSDVLAQKLTWLAR